MKAGRTNEEGPWKSTILPCESEQEISSDLEISSRRSVQSRRQVAHVCARDVGVACRAVRITAAGAGGAVAVAIAVTRTGSSDDALAVIRTVTRGAAALGKATVLGVNISRGARARRTDDALAVVITVARGTAALSKATVRSGINISCRTRSSDRGRSDGGSRRTRATTTDEQNLRSRKKGKRTQQQQQFIFHNFDAPLSIHTTTAQHPFTLGVSEMTHVQRMCRAARGAQDRNKLGLRRSKEGRTVRTLLAAKNLDRENQANRQSGRLSPAAGTGHPDV
jgi:hypothetical protein